MNLIAFALFDNKAQFFGTPFFMPHRGHAIRAVIELGQDMQTTVGRYPNDFVLYEIGYFDDQVGMLTSNPPQNLGPVSTFLPLPSPSLTPIEDAIAAAKRKALAEGVPV